jgi:hypothetical protein
MVNRRLSSQLTFQTVINIGARRSINRIPRGVADVGHAPCALNTPRSPNNMPPIVSP